MISAETRWFPAALISLHATRTPGDLITTDQMRTVIATLNGLFLKPLSGSPMIAPDDGVLMLKARFGILDDANACSISPRQVLITRQEESDGFGISPGDLLENIAISGLCADEFVPGSILHIGDSVQIRLTFYCEPCKRIGHLVPTLHDIVQKRGILGVVLRGGVVQVGDSVRAETDGFLALSEVPYERFLNYIGHVPAGKVVTYKQILIGIGVTHGYYRALPGYIKRTSPADYPLHRIVDSRGRLLLETMPGQIAMLEAEGVQVKRVFDSCGEQIEASIEIETSVWEDENFYSSQWATTERAPH